MHKRKSLPGIVPALFVAALLAGGVSRAQTQESQTPTGTAAGGAQASPAAAGAATGAINGTIHTANGAPVPGASLRLVETASGKAWVSWTDENGKFSLPGLPAGHYRIEVAQLGMDTATKEFDFTGSAAAPVDVTLKVSTLAAIEESAKAQQEANAEANQGQGKAPQAGAEQNGAQQNGPANSQGSGAGSGQTQAAAGGAGGGRGGNGGYRRYPGGGGGAGGGRPGGAGGQNGGQNGAAGAGPNGGGPPGAREGQNGAAGAGNENFQQLALANEQEQPGAEEAGGDIGSAPADAGTDAGLGQAASSDAFLMNGTVGQGVADTGGFAGGPPGGFGGGGGDLGGTGGAPGGVPGQAGAAPVPSAPGGAGFGGPGGPGGGGGAPGMNIRLAPAGGGGGGGRGGRGGGGGGRGPAPAQGVAALWGMQRVMRQRANQIHWSLYDQYSNSALDARPYALTGGAAPKISAWNEWLGGNVGGPLKIPHIYDGSDKTFLFLNFDTTWARNAVDEYSTVPTLAERGGDFTDRGTNLLCPSVEPYPASTALGAALAADCPTAGALMNPSNPTVIPANIMSALPAASSGLLNYIPAPNLAGLVDNYHLQDQVPTQQDRLNVRLLQTISAKFSARAIYAFSQSANHAFANFPSFESDTGTRGQSVTLGLTQNWTWTLINDTQLIYSRNRVQTLNGFAFQNDVAGDLGITGVSTAPIDWGVPQLSFTNFTGPSTPVPSLVRNQTYRLVDGVTKMLSKHTLQAGAELRRIENSTVTDPVPEGRFTFNGLETGNDFSDFLLGLPYSTDERFGTAANYFRGWGSAAYFTDDWRIQPNFTMEYGVRYEYFTPFSELYGHLSDLAVNPTFTEAAAAVPGQAGPFGEMLPSGLIKPQGNHWAPRLGFAWRPPLAALQGKHSTTVRAGYGMFYNESVYSQLVGELANQPPWATSGMLLTTAGAPLTLQNGFPSSATPTNTALNTYAVNPNYKDGYAQIWNVSVETSLRTNLTFVATYTGTKGTNLDMLIAPNRPPPGSTVTTGPVAGAGDFIYDTSGANSIYNALQVRLQQRMSHGIGWALLYTYGKSMDDASSIGGGQGVVVQNPEELRAEYGLSSFDVRHQFRANYTYELPLGGRHRFAQKGFTGAVFGDWRLSGNIALHSGSPFTAEVLGTGAGNTGGGGAFALRADQICNPSLPASERSPLHFFNTACFVVPAAGQFGDAARNTIEGPGSFSWNAQIAKTFTFGKDQNHRLDVRWEVTNLTNTPNFTGLSTVVNSSTYGRVTSVSGMRSMDVMTRFNF